jgi:hypothetical protein
MGCVIIRTTGTQPKIGEAYASTVAECLGRSIKWNEKINQAGLLGGDYVIAVGTGRNGEGVSLQTIKPAAM